MARPKRNSGRRARSRKRSGAGAANAPADSAVAAPPMTRAETRRARAEARKSGVAGPVQRPQRDPGGFGERPQAPWHPFPLSELLILIGLVAIAVGASKGQSGLAILFTGVGAVLLGTLDFSVREHLSGYRAHSSLLAAVPTAVLHGGFALALHAVGAPSEALVLVPLALDVPLFMVLFKLLRGRFDDARRERVQAARR